MENQQEPFQIGLVLAGAVSAGAYSAGVMDYLIEALEAWYEAKAESNTNVPQHDVRLRVLTGASAGGITAAIAASYLFKKGSNPEATSPLYKTWVEDIDISQLLKTKDLQQSDSLQSLLDSTVIDDIADNVINPKALMSATTDYQPLPFIHPRLKLYLTLSNLRGLPYAFNLEGANSFKYGMYNHADYQYAEISDHTTSGDWERIKQAAKATGAFPIGLSARLIERDTSEYKDRTQADGRDLSRFLKLDTESSEPYNFVAVDGGTLNNEPLELARSALKEKPRVKSFNQSLLSNPEAQPDQKTCEEMSSAIILIDPFPNTLEESKNATRKDTALARIFLPLINALRGQSMFKPEELLLTTNNNVFNRFMIAPIRRIHDRIAAHPIACGLLGGFGGFLSRKFREHDYHLGRRNCQRFLDRYFAVSVKEFQQNPIFQGNLNRDYIFKRNDKEYYPIIPLVPEMKKEEGVNNPWPEFAKDEFNALKMSLKRRIYAVLYSMGMLREAVDSAKWILPIFILSYALTFYFQLRCDCEISWHFEALRVFLMLIILLAVLVLCSWWYFKSKTLRSITKVIQDSLQEYGLMK